MGFFNIFDIIDFFIEPSSPKIGRTGGTPNIVSNPNNVKQVKTSDIIVKFGSLYTGESEDKIKKRLRENSDGYKKIEKTEKVIDNPISLVTGNSYRLEAEIEDKISISYGAIIFCDLHEYFEHSGVCTSRNTVIELNKSGNIKEVPIKKFLSDSSKKIYILTNNQGLPLISTEAVQRAKQWLNEKRNYNVIFDNCHQFISGCLTGNFENSDNAFWMLKNTAEKVFKTEIKIREYKE